MREATSKTIRHMVRKASQRKGLPYTKNQLRRAKRFYTKLPHTMKHKFEVN